MWTNPEINMSDAFVAAWLPGSEGGGVSDLLFQRDPSYNFTGRLSFTWPNIAKVEANTVSPGDDALFNYGYGMSYEDIKTLDQLSEAVSYTHLTLPTICSV